MERKIGEIFNINGQEHQFIPGDEEDSTNGIFNTNQLGYLMYE